MRMIPPRPPESSNGSERVVYSLLSRCQGDSCNAALSSLNLSQHEYKRWGEIDFVLIATFGLLAIEVKGGIVSCREGIWHYEDRSGRTIERGESPMAQVQSAFSSLLKKSLIPNFGDASFKSVAMGFCVVMPRTSRVAAKHFLGTPDMPRVLVATQEDCVSVSTFERFIESVVSHWRQQIKVVYTPWSSEMTSKVVKSLRPSFDRVPPISVARDLVRNEQHELTEDQYSFIDYLESAPRVLCDSAAGTGKTFLAVECLRREVEGSAVLITGTQRVADFVRANQHSLSQNVYSFEELMATPKVCIGSYKTLIVDEGQQITTIEAFEALEAMMRLPLSQCRWRWFTDTIFQVTQSSQFDASAQEYLCSIASIQTTLKQNCRNTPQIVNAVEFASGIPIGTTGVKGSGPVVVYAQSQGKIERLGETARHVRQWLQDGTVRPGQITLLSALPQPDSSVERLAALIGYPVKKWTPTWEQEEHYPRYFATSTIENFRGLESQFVVLCDLGSDREILRQQLYLGLTRANFAAFVECDKEALNELVISQITSKIGN